jgi:hypothetical protein
MESLRLAILADCKDSLENPENGFSEESKKDECACYNNLHVLLRVLNEEKYKNDKWIEHWFSNLERHVLDKRCKHVWEKTRMNAAAWDIAEAKRS